MMRNAPWEKAADKSRRKTNNSNHGLKAVATPEIRQPIDESSIVFRRPRLQKYCVALLWFCKLNFDCVH